MKVLKCKACGAFLEYKVGAPVSICGYCDVVNIISEDVLKPISNSNASIQEVVGDAMMIEEKYMANYFLSTGLSQGGRLLISKNEIFFRPHKLNIGELSDKYFKISEIESFEKSGYTKGKDLFVFPYDWRKSLSTLGDDLDKFIIDNNLEFFFTD